MLVISRKPEEVICIGDDIQIRVLGIVGNSVRLGVSAPRAIPVHRQEVYDAIQAENDAARNAPKRIDGLL